MLAVLLLVLSLGQSGPVEAEPPQAPAQPRWIVRPRVDPSPRLYRSGLETASATITCRANADGSVNDCRIAAEDPPGSGLGSALVKAARDARVDPASLGSSASGSRIAFTARFRLD